MNSPGIIQRVKTRLDNLRAVIKREPRDLQALIEILRIAEKRNLLDPDVLIMIEGALHVSDMQVRDVMVPRIQMIVINAGSSPEDIISTVVDSGHSRFPVTGDDANDILGILLAKDLLSYFADSGTENFDIKDMMRPAVFIPESKRLNVLLREFRGSRNHMAIVVDEYGVAGLVTIEDVIEEIVGEIEDEHDIEEEESITTHGRDRYTVKAITPVDEFNEYFGTSLSDEDYDTIGGLVISIFGHLPRRGETTELAGFNVKVLRADKRRVHLLRFVKTGEPEPVETG
ncbi:MAG: transporter associated domain-containing protein [Gammaproteobacteria bacterium]|jgi:magnesium and cobalt transporter